MWYILVLPGHLKKKFMEQSIQGKVQEHTYLHVER